MNSILADFIAKLNDKNDISSVEKNGCEYMKLSYEEYKNIKKSNDVLYIIDDAPTTTEIANGVTGKGGIIETKGKVFKGDNECSPIDKNESLMDIAIRNGYNGIEYIMDDGEEDKTPIFSSYTIVENEFDDIKIDKRLDSILYIKKNQIEIRIWDSINKEWNILYKKASSPIEVDENIKQLINEESDRAKASEKEISDKLNTEVNNLKLIDIKLQDKDKELNEYINIINNNISGIISGQINNIYIGDTKIDKDGNGDIKLPIYPNKVTLSGKVNGSSTFNTAGEINISTDVDLDLGNVASKNTYVRNITLVNSSWVADSDGKYIYTINDGVIKDNDDVDGILGLVTDSTIEEYEACAKAKIIIKSVSIGTMILKCYGTKPTINIRIVITLTY